MVSIFLDNLCRLMGHNFDEKEIIKEALTQSDDYNRPLAEVGDSVLNLVVKKKAYLKNKNSEYIDHMRKKFADKYANQSILNKDIGFTKYLSENKYTRSPVGGIGLDKADRFVEAIIGAIFISRGFQDALKFTLEILYTNDEFIEEFNHVHKG